MVTQFWKTPALLLMLAFAALFFSGCANTMNAVENRKLAVEVKTSETIFLDPVTLSASPNVYVRVTNTSDFQDLDFAQELKGKLASMGYNITNSPAEAQYLVTANILFMGENASKVDMNSVVSSGFGGALVGAGVAGASGSSWRGAGTAGLAAGAVIAGGEMVSGMMFKVKEYLGVVDLQVREQVEGGVTGTEVAQVSQGSSTTRTMERNVSSSHQEYRTRIGIAARQTNIDRAEAIAIISERLKDQIGGIFRL